MAKSLIFLKLVFVSPDNTELEFPKLLTIYIPFSRCDFGPRGVRVLPLAAGINEGGHYFRYIIPLVILSCLLTTAIQNHRRGCRRVSNFCMGS